MGEYLDQIPEEVRGHIRDITKLAGLQENDESLEMMAEAWIEKKNAFEKNIESVGMEELDFVDMENGRGILVMTYSGSLVNVGPIIDGERSVEYTSIGLRSDVPDSAESENAKLATDISINEEMEFESGPVKSTSAVFKIAICRDDISIEEQEQALEKATLMLADDFTKINKTLIID